MKLLRMRKKLSVKITAMTCLIILSFCLAIGWLYAVTRDNQFENRRSMVKHQVETAWGVLDHFNRQVKAGTLSLEQAQQQAKEAVKHLRYGGNDYFWINDLASRVVMHPIKPELDGKDLSTTKDANGKKLFVAFVETCQKDGEGFVDYYWPKPGLKEPVAKISYVKLFPEWGWIIGNGLYVDDVNAALAHIFNTNVALVLGVILVTVVLIILLTRSISVPLQRINHAVAELAQGNTDIKLPIGAAVNCSERKNCGETDCVSFGKTDACWVSAGSFSVDKQCPHAARGENCRSCELYGPQSEMEELGSAITALAHAMEARSHLALQIANGDLTKSVKIASDNDKLGQALARMHENLKNILCQVQAAGLQIAADAGQVSNTSQLLADGATQQASFLEQITSSMNLIASQTKLNADNATQANQLTSQGRDAARNGNQQMAEMTAAMDEINEAGQNISKIIKVIDEIAFQTNLLALNAAVEAARAGQHGKGFAVVAEEVRSLAARSAQAARETAELIEGSVQKTRNGSQIADQTSVALEEIVGGVAKVAELVAEIAAASNEQAQGFSQVNQGLSQIDQVTQANTANAEQSAAAAEVLSSQAAHMKQMLGRFRLKPQAGHRDQIARD